MALTPSLYHSKLSSIFFKVKYCDLALLRSRSRVWTSLTCLPSRLFFSTSRFCMASIRPFISPTSVVKELSRLLTLLSEFCVDITFLLAAASSSLILFRRLLRLSLLSAAF